MDRNTPHIVVEGIEELIGRDLEKSKSIIEITKREQFSYKAAVSHEIKKKRYYISLIGGDKFNDDALRKSISDINVNITHMQNKVKATQDKIAHYTTIVDTLTVQLAEQMDKLKVMREDLNRERNVISN